MKKYFSIEVPAEYRYLAIIRNFYSQCLKGSGLVHHDNDVLHLELAINEFCENVIKHGYDGPGGYIMIKIKVDRDSINTAIFDNGIPHNMLEYKPIDKQTLVEKGIRGKLGIRMIRTVCSDIQYRRLVNRNRTVFIKNIVS